MEDFIKSNDLKRRVLVVDDELKNREILGNILATAYEVVYAEDGAHALELLKDRNVRYSLILLDLLMPNMDGFEFLTSHYPSRYFLNPNCQNRNPSHNRCWKNCRYFHFPFWRFLPDIPDTLYIHPWFRNQSSEFPNPSLVYTRNPVPVHSGEDPPAFHD
ncbi:MAG: response regulator [Lachnospiraceae bacterium]|nr:response regulator [Lachnospiraceae bacterium]